MSIRIALLTIALASSAWAAQSDTLRAAEAGLKPGFCSTLRELIAAAPKNFVALRGKPREAGEHAWAGTKRLPGGGECSVFGGKPSSYVCTLYAGDNGDDADNTYQSAAAGLKDCLSGDWKTTEQADGTHARTRTFDRGAGAAVRLVTRDLSGAAYMVELWVDAKP